MSNRGASSYTESQRYDGDDDEEDKQESYAAEEYSGNGTGNDLEEEEEEEEEDVEDVEDVEEGNESVQDMAETEQMGETDAFSNVARGLDGHNRDLLMEYWQTTINSIEHDDFKFKIHHLPLARIKKVMKADQDVKMISAEAPILFAKGCDIFITELTMRAWIHAEDNKRRTLQRSDIANALQKSDMFDFLIDIVPREEAQPKSRTVHGGSVTEEAPPYTKEYAEQGTNSESTGETSESQYRSNETTYERRQDNSKHNSQSVSENRHNSEQGYNEVYQQGYGEWDGYKQY